jgi:hypothetical protein
MKVVQLGAYDQHVASKIIILFLKMYANIFLLFEKSNECYRGRGGVIEALTASYSV